MKHYNCLSSECSNGAPPPIDENVEILNCMDCDLTNLNGLHDSLNEILCGRNLIKKLDKLPRDLRKFSCWNNPIENIEGIWKCKKLEVIYFDQKCLIQELKLYKKINNCRLIFYAKDGIQRELKDK